VLTTGICGLLGLGGLSACGDRGYVGPLLRVSGSWNGEAKGDHAAPLLWDEGSGTYQGIVELPGDTLRLRLYSPYTDALIGAGDNSPGGAIPATLKTAGGDDKAAALQVITPVLARYSMVYDPGATSLRIDLADDAEVGQPPGAKELVLALRGADRLDSGQQAQRASALQGQIRDLNERGLEMPLQIGGDRTDRSAGSGVTFLAFGEVDSTDYSVVGNFNGWMPGADPIQVVLDGTVGYRAHVVSGTRLEYRLALHGLRRADPLNAEVVWDGAYLPANLKNILGGNVGDFNSVGVSPGYVEQGSRLRVVRLPVREVYVYLPPHYDAQRSARYPSIYIHDGKDAIVRGHYNQALDQLISGGSIPSVVAVFIPALSDADARLAEFAHFSDPYFSDIQPRGSAYEQMLLEGILPAIEAQFNVSRLPDERAMLGVDMAGALSFYVAWHDKQQRFRRVGSQSGRFGWGAMRDQTTSPYTDLLRMDQSAVMKRLSFDWADGDQFQVALHETVLKPLFQGNPGYANKVSFVKQDKPVMGVPSPTVWDNWRSRLDMALKFLLSDLPKN